ncbi:zinc finger BED domain-containing protein RICESLEEPER 2-like [Andrographis paniculata]|uniref:zinc finger BED domain-containing protein RICESLEEPER 2-like n=1 Tax=Andrographis paniculata TaxID=175694 RepID=UPI0021E759AD|nr:zinc finger BED domain-containing protein RICESLEEPER 2-like [Andrographis paniculata]
MASMDETNIFDLLSDTHNSISVDSLSSQPVDDNRNEDERNSNQANEGANRKKRKKTSIVWNDFDEIQVAEGVKKAICKYCKNAFATGGRGASTSHLKRHSEGCLQRTVQMASQKKQCVIPFKPSNSSNPFISPGFRFSNEKMREVIATSIMVHEYPFSIVEDDAFIWSFQYANPEFQKVSRKTIRSDCIAIYEAERKALKELLKSVSKISLTTDMWKSSHQVIEYMVITGHFIDSGWKLQKRILSFVKVPAPRRGIDVANAIFKCLKAWGIEDKVFSISVDNASYNDSCLRYLKDYISRSTKLVLDGALFHVRCCAHILNLLVQDGLSRIKDIIHNVRESVKYVNFNDSRLKSFGEVVEQKHLKERKLIIDCPTRWNSTYHMLAAALKFKIVFSEYQEREPHYTFAPSNEDWEKVEKVCKLLEVFNLATNLISGSEYPTANLYLSEVWKVKQVIDDATKDDDLFMIQMATQMKEKFDKYWGECNLLMAVANVLDPRVKFHGVEICFPMIYKSEEVAAEYVNKVRASLQQLYNDYVALSVEESSSSQCNMANISSATTQSESAIVIGFDQIMSLVRAKEAIPVSKSELDAYLEDSVYIPDGNMSSFCALEWWRNNNMKYKVLSKMAADVLAIPISTVASESTFSAGGRIIDEYRSRLNEESIETLICGGDWLRHKYNLKKKEGE